VQLLAVGKLCESWLSLRTQSSRRVLMIVRDWMPNVASSSSMARTADGIGDTLAACRHDSTLGVYAF
jgi:hypothetical protein